MMFAVRHGGVRRTRYDHRRGVGGVEPAHGEPPQRPSDTRTTTRRRPSEKGSSPPWWFRSGWGGRSRAPRYVSNCASPVLHRPRRGDPDPAGRRRGHRDPERHPLHPPGRALRAASWRSRRRGACATWPASSTTRSASSCTGLRLTLDVPEPPSPRWATARAGPGPGAGAARSAFARSRSTCGRASWTTWACPRAAGQYRVLHEPDQSLRVHLEHSGPDRRFAPETETGVYRIVQEALTNVARHGRVDEVTVRLWATDDVLAVQVEQLTAPASTRTRCSAPAEVEGSPGCASAPPS